MQDSGLQQREAQKHNRGGDEKNVMIVSYHDLKRALMTAFEQLTAGGY